MQEAIPRLKKQGGGNVIMITSCRTELPLPGGAIPDIARAGANALVKSLSIEATRVQNRPGYQSKNKGYYKYGRRWSQFFADDSTNEWLLSFTLHQGTKRPGFDPVNVTTSWSGQVNIFGLFYYRALAAQHNVFMPAIKFIIYIDQRGGKL